MKIFWSWQSDTPGKTGRHFIRQALLDAIEALKQPEDIEEPTEREQKEALHLDHDRQGVPGSPDLARTILDKIGESAVFVADVTPVSVIPRREIDGETITEKRNMNPNVAIELGYALRALGDEKFLMVLNTYYGDRTFLPFDLAHKAGPITFCLPPTADRQERDKESAALTRRFVAMLTPYLRNATSAAPGSTVRRTSSTASAAIYFEPGEVLASIGEPYERVEFSYPDSDGVYLRVSPQSPIAQPSSRTRLMNEVRNAGLWAMWRTPSGVFSDNRFGAIVVEPVSPKGGDLKASSQVFANGEIWGFAPWLLTDHGYGPCIPAQAFETTLRQTLRRYLDFLALLKITPPYCVEVGAVGLKDFRIVVDNTWDNSLGPIYDNEYRIEKVLNEASPASLDAFLLQCFEALFQLAGESRPAGLYGFPAASSQ